ncbi:MAG: hypothetical protein ABSC92_12950 [Rhizomicrobium sp.]|jgi:hypothetical protein
MKRVVIREANLYEYDDIWKFYQKNPDDHVMIRAEEAVKSAIADGVFFMALDTDIISDGDRIFAVSAVYSKPYLVEGGGTVLLKEAGGSLVHPGYRGYSIHKIFHCARVLHEFILDRGGFAEYFGAIICPNDPSVSNIERAGFVPWTNPPAALCAERAPFAKEGQEIRFFRFPIEALPALAEQLLRAADQGKIVKAEGDKIEEWQLVVDLQLLRWYRPILEGLAKRDFNVLK